MADTASTPERLALVTGTTSGIGAAVARRLLDRDWQVVGIARRTPPFHHPRYTHLRVDLGNLDALQASVGDFAGPLLHSRPWQVAGLVNNAADPGVLRRLDRQSASEMIRVYAVNVAAPCWLMGLVVRASPPGASVRIVNVSSGAAAHPFPGLSTYSASKAALRMAGLVFATELGTRDCSIVSYEPGVVDTEMQLTARSQSDEFPSLGMFRQFKAQGQLSQPSEPAADIVGFLEGQASERFSELAFQPG
jgi:benzil reductase ((S)-benzoin forming)